MTYFKKKISVECLIRNTYKINITNVGSLNGLPIHVHNDHIRDVLLKA